MSKSSWSKKADSAWYEYQHRIWQRCAVCRCPGVQAHHLITKGQKLTAFDPENGIGLCPEHHQGSTFSAHGTPEKFIEWLEKNRQKQYEYFQTNRNRHGYSLTEEYYKDAYHKLKELTRIENETDPSISQKNQCYSR